MNIGIAPARYAVVTTRKENKMGRRTYMMALMCIVMLAGGAALAQDADLKAAAKAVVETDGGAVVPLKVVTSMTVSYEGEEWPSEEEESEALGTVLDETGLIVASDAATNPAKLRRYRPPYKVESQVKAVKLVLKDGTEVPLKTVLRDSDLDLVFLRPEQETDLPHIDTVKAGAEMELGDEAIVLSRLGAAGNRSPYISIGRVQAVVEKPRRFYVATTVANRSTLGCPVYTAVGELVGIAVIRTNAGPGTGQSGMSILPIVLPLADVLEDVAQIEEVKAEEQEKKE